MRAATLTIFVSLLAGAATVNAQEGGFEIKRVFESSGIATKIVIEVPAASTIKCAVYDAQDNPLRVETSSVTPPIDEIMILTGEVTSQVQSAKCWKME